MSQRSYCRVFLLLALAVVGVGCRREADSVAVIPRTTATALWEPMHMGVLEEAKGSGLHVYWNAPADEGETGKQMNMLSEAVKGARKGIILAPDETLAARSMVLEAVDHRIPVVIINDELGPPPGPYLSYVTNDERLGARLVAERLASLLHGHGRVALLGISPRSEGGLTREQYVERALAEVAPGIEIGIRRFGDTVITHQQQLAQAMLDGDDHVDAIVALTATATRGAFYAKIASDRHPAVVILGFDQDMLPPVQMGAVDSVVVQDTRAIGRLAMRNLQAQLRGETVPGTTVVAPLLLTQQTAGSAQMQQVFSYSKFSWRDQ